MAVKEVATTVWNAQDFVPQPLPKHLLKSLMMKHQALKSLMVTCASALSSTTGSGDSGFLLGTYAIMNEQASWASSNRLSGKK
jgi:hypothetical protein